MVIAGGWSPSEWELVGKNYNGAAIPSRAAEIVLLAVSPSWMTRLRAAAGVARSTGWRRACILNFVGNLSLDITRPIN